MYSKAESRLLPAFRAIGEVGVQPVAVQALVGSLGCQHRPGEPYLLVPEADQLEVDGDQHPDGLACPRTVACWRPVAGWRAVAAGAAGVLEELDEPLGGDLGLDGLAVRADGFGSGELLQDTRVSGIPTALRDGEGG